MRVSTLALGWRSASPHGSAALFWLLRQRSRRLSLETTYPACFATACKSLSTPCAGPTSHCSFLQRSDIPDRLLTTWGTSFRNGALPSCPPEQEGQGLHPLASGRLRRSMGTHDYAVRCRSRSSKAPVSLHRRNDRLRSSSTGSVFSLPLATTSSSIRLSPCVMGDEH